MRTPELPPEPARRGKLRRTAAAVRSSLRRYPPEIVASLLRQGQPDPRPFRDLLAEIAPDRLAVSWLGHASVAAGLGRFTLVVDPVLSDRIGPRVGRRTIGLSRREPAPIDPESVRGVDAILITHAHFDHLDRPTLERLADPRTTVIVPRRCKRLVPGGFGRVVELLPGETCEVSGAAVRAIRPEHWGARTMFDRRRSMCAYEVRHPEASVLFTGDTALTDAFDRIGPIDLAVFGIGAYEPWEHMHATPEQVWRMFLSCGASLMLPVHDSTFELSDEPPGEPLRRLIAAAGPESWRILRERPGEVLVVPLSEDERSSETTKD